MHSLVLACMPWCLIHDLGRISSAFLGDGLTGARHPRSPMTGARHPRSPKVPHPIVIADGFENPGTFDLQDVWKHQSPV